MTNKDQLNNLEQLEGVLRNLYIDGEISEEKYQAGLISIAGSYALLDRKTETINLIARLSTKFMDNLADFLKNDPILRSKALLVAEYLNDGLIETNEEDAQIELLVASMDRSRQPS